MRYTAKPAKARNKGKHQNRCAQTNLRRIGSERIALETSNPLNQRKFLLFLCLRGIRNKWLHFHIIAVKA
jgi:hypothetical protein